MSNQDSPREARVPRRAPVFVFASAAVASITVLVALGLVALLDRGPATPTAEVYRVLLEHRTARGRVHAEPRPPSVLERAVVPEDAAQVEPREQAPESEADRLFGAAVSRIRIERIGVDARIVPLNLNSDGDMDVPRDPEFVAWYDFTSKPGIGGNAVFSGHRDWRNYGPAVFWELDELEPGDEIEIELADGTVLQYAVTAARSYPAAALNMAEILAPTTRESVTLITCGGVFSSGQYVDRHIVRAVRTGVVPSDS